MLQEGAFNDPKPDAVFGLHVFPYPVGTVATRAGGLMASSDFFRITVQGKQTHGAVPWAGVDPIVTASQIVLGLQTIVSRQLDATLTPSIVTVGKIEGGVRNNIIPESVEMVGTIRTFDADTRLDIHERVRRIATQTAAAAGGATAEVEIDLGYGVTRETIPPCFRQMSPDVCARWRAMASLKRSRRRPPRISHTSQTKRRALFLIPRRRSGRPCIWCIPNHSPRFYADEGALPVGVRALTALTLDYMADHNGR